MGEEKQPIHGEYSWSHTDGAKVYSEMKLCIAVEGDFSERFRFLDDRPGSQLGYRVRERRGKCVEETTKVVCDISIEVSWFEVVNHAGTTGVSQKKERKKFKIPVKKEYFKRIAPLQCLEDNEFAFCLKPSSGRSCSASD